MFNNIIIAIIIIKDTENSIIIIENTKGISYHRKIKMSSSTLSKLINRGFLMVFKKSTEMAA